MCITMVCMMILSLAACRSGENKEMVRGTRSGTVSTDGSTSMEKVIGGLGEMFMELNSGITFTYNPTGSGSGIKAVQEDRCDIGLAPGNETILDGTYVIQRPFVLITKANAELNTAAKAFFDYALSKEAHELIIAAGVGPASN